MAKAQRKPEQSPVEAPQDKPERVNYSDRVAQLFADAVANGTAKWMKPWNPGDGGDLPFNPTTGNRYRGVNSLYLDAMGDAMSEAMGMSSADPRWMTYKQAGELGAQVKRGAHVEREPEPEQAQQQRRSRTREPLAARAAR